MNRSQPDPAPSAVLVPSLFVVLWASGFVVARLVTAHADPLTFLSVRYAVAALVLGLAAAWVRAPWPATPAGWRDGLIIGMLLHGGYLGGIFWAVSHGLPAGIAALVSGLQPLVTGLLVGPMLGERVTPRRWCGIVIGFAGAFLVIAPRLGGGDAIAPATLVAGFAAVLSITLGTIWQKRTGATADLRTVPVVQFLGAIAVTLPVALLTEQGRLDATPQFWIGFVWATFGLSIGAVYLLLLLIRRGAVAGVAALLYLVPPVSALMAYALFGETLGPIQMAGMAIAAFGVAMASRG